MQANQEYDLSKPLATAIKAKAPFVGIPNAGICAAHPMPCETRSGTEGSQAVGHSGGSQRRYALADSRGSGKRRTCQNVYEDDFDSCRVLENVSGQGSTGEVEGICRT